MSHREDALDAKHLHAAAAAVAAVPVFKDTEKGGIVKAHREALLKDLRAKPATATKNLDFVMSKLCDHGDTMLFDAAAGNDNLFYVYDKLEPREVAPLWLADAYPDMYLAAYRRRLKTLPPNPPAWFAQRFAALYEEAARDALHEQYTALVATATEWRDRANFARQCVRAPRSRSAQ